MDREGNLGFTQINKQARIIKTNHGTSAVRQDGAVRRQAGAERAYLP